MGRSNYNVDMFNDKSECISYVQESKRYYRVSPELSDGEHWTIIEDKKHLLDAIGEWVDSGPVESESFKVEIVEMTDEEVDALPVL